MMVARMIAALALFCILSVCITSSKSLPQRKEISQGKERCDHCEDLIKANASDLDFLRSSKQSLKPDLPSKNILDRRRQKKRVKRVKELPEESYINARKVPRFVSSVEGGAFKEIRKPRMAVENSPAANFNLKMRSKRSLYNVPPEISNRALTNLQNQTSNSSKPANDTPSFTNVTMSSKNKTSSFIGGISSTINETSSSTAGISSTINETSSSKAGISYTTTVTLPPPPRISSVTPPVTSPPPRISSVTPPETPSSTENEEYDPWQDFIEGLAELFNQIYFGQDYTEQIYITEQEITDFFMCLLEYIDSGMAKPLSEECGNTMDEQLFEDLIDYFDLPTESLSYDLEDIYADLEDFSLRSGFDSRDNGTRRAQSDADNASSHQKSSPTTEKKGFRMLLNSIDTFRRYQKQIMSEKN